MNRKNLFILFIVSILLTMFVSTLNSSKDEFFYKGSDLPGQIGLVKVDSKYIANVDKKGFLTYGPYAELREGKYSVVLTYSSYNAKGIRYDIVADAGKTVKKDGKLLENTTNKQLEVFVNINSNSKLEIRTWYDGYGELSLHSIKIKKQIGLVDFLTILKYFIVSFLLGLLILYAFRFSKKITIFSILLIILIIFSFIIDAYTSYYKYKEITYKNMPLTKDIFKYYLRQSLESEYIKLTAQQLEKSDTIESFHIMINKKDLDYLDSDLPLSGIDKYVDARLKINDEKSLKVKIRYRGGSAWNWRYDKKSIKIKFKDSDSYHMMKTINFSVLYSQDMFIEAITQKIADHVGALAPEVKIVKMYINGEYKGLYLYLDQIDESFLRKNKLMPGSIYDGDYSLKKEWSSYIGTNGVAKLWYDSKIWEKKAARNAEQKKNREDIELLINAVNKYDDINFYNFANTYLSDQYYSYLALDVLWGTHHHDYFHNHKIYFDPYKGKYTAISWDVRFWRSNSVKDNSYYPLIERIGLNPLLEYKRDKELYRLLQIVNIEYINNLMTKEKDKFMNPYLADKERKKIAIDTKLFPWKETFNPPQLVVANTDDINNVYNHYLNNMEARLEYLYKMLEDITVKYTIEKNSQNTRIIYSVNGNTPVKINYKNLILYPARKIIDKNALNLDSAGYGNTHLENTAQFYELSIPNKKFDESIFRRGINAITGKKVLFEKVSKIDIHKTDSIHPWKLPQPVYKTKILNGKIEVKETLVFDKYTTVNIEPGTTFIMDANTSIYFYGKVIAQGTKEKPIKFLAKDPTKPWGLVAVQGKATTGSKFVYCEFENGSIDTKNLINYTSQFNIHDMDWFEVRHCKIGRNFVGDDAMHIAYAKGIVDNCEFTDARSDGLDIDISDVKITNNIFYKSGNDGLDIMTTTMNASNNVFIDMGDKGISVGEWSEANITDSFFLRTLIGTEVKDKSKVLANNLIYVDSKEKAINLYNKNKRYDTGGFLEAEYIYLLGNIEIKADKRSSQKIENRVENKLPDLKQYKWYKNLQNTLYKKYVEEIEVKYEK